MAYYHPSQNLKDLLFVIFEAPIALTKITYFLIFHLDLDTQSQCHLPMFNFLRDLTAFFKAFQKRRDYVLSSSLIRAEFELDDRHLEHFLEMVDLVQSAIGISAFSLGNPSWVNFILELEVPPPRF